MGIFDKLSKLVGPGPVRSTTPPPRPGTRAESVPEILIMRSSGRFYDVFCDEPPALRACVNASREWTWVDFHTGRAIITLDPRFDPTGAIHRLEAAYIERLPGGAQ